MIKGLLVAIMIGLAGCGGDVHEIAPGEGNKNLQQAMGTKPTIKTESMAPSKKSVANSLVAHKPIVQTPLKEEDNNTEAMALKMIEKLHQAKVEKRQEEEKKFENEYRMAQAQIQKDILVAKIGKNTSLELAELEAQKAKEMKQQELAVSLENNKLQSVIKSKEITANMEKTKIEQAIKEKELSTSIEQAKLQNALALEQQKNDAVISHERMDLFKIMMIVVAVLILITLLMIYFISKRNREVKVALQEKEILNAREMQVIDHQNQRVNKMLEIVSSQKLSENVEKELLDSIKDANKTIWMVEDDKGSKKGLIFKG